MKIFLKKTILLISVILIILISNVTHAAFTEPTTAPSSSDQDFPQNILGANNNNNDFDSTNVTANNDGSLIERLEYIITSLSSLWTKVGNLLYYNTGNVGIGTSTPSALLEVSGDGQSALKVTDVTNSITTGIWSGTTQGSIGTLTNTDLRFLTNGTSKMTIDTSGNVGVGTTGPEYLMDAQTASGNAQFRIKSGGDLAQMILVSTDTSISGTSAINFADADDINIGQISYYHPNDSLTFRVNDASKMIINSSGNVGIGTTGPSAKLQIYDNTAGSNVDGLYIYKASDESNYALKVKHDTSVSSRVVADFQNQLGSVLYIQGDGNVGIGTTAPGAKLEVSGGRLRVTLRNSGTIELLDDGTAAAGSVNLMGRDSGGTATTYAFIQGLISDTTDTSEDGALAFYTTLAGTSAEKVRITNSGNVGIGTTGPNELLEIAGEAGQGTTPPTLRINNLQHDYSNSATLNVPHGSIEFYATESSGTYLPGVTTSIKSINEGSYATVFGLGFFTYDDSAENGEERMRITGTGNVGIGVTGPGAKLTVVSTSGEVFRADAVSGAYRIIANQSYVLLNGNVGIGITNPGYKLTVAGTAWVTSGAWSGSDRRWKKDIVSLTNSLDKINQLQGVSYNWRTDEFPEMNFGTNTQLGFIAQDVEPIIPEVVTTNSDGYKGISYEKLVPVLVEGMKELRREKDTDIEELNIKLGEKDEEVKELKNIVEELQKEVESLKNK